MLHVLEAGLHTLIVDHGRPSHRSLGVPLGGAADRASLAIGNALLGNAPDAAALEITLTGPTLQAECDIACVVHGAPFVLQCGLRALEAGKSFTLRAGEVLRIGGTPQGMRGYLCIRGGIDSPVILGSRSALAPVRTGDVLRCPSGTTPVRSIAIRWEWDASRPSPESLFVLPGPQADWFPGNVLHAMATNGSPPGFTVSPKSNRMGMRLQGNPVPVPDRELVSEPVCPGSVQVTRDGQLVVLGMDGQTIGGYPKIAQVIRADLDRLGQLRPGDPVTFAPIDQEMAENLYRCKMAELRRWLTRLRLVCFA